MSIGLQRIKLYWGRLGFLHKTSSSPSPEERDVLDMIATYDWQHFSIKHFAGWLQERYERKVSIEPFHPSPTLFGTWFRTDEAEYIFYSDRINPFLQAQVIFHEVSHWRLGHSTLHLTTQQLRYAATGGAISFEGLHYMCKRSATERTLEDEQAERFAMLMLAQLAAEIQPIVNNNFLKNYLDEWTL